MHNTGQVFQHLLLCACFAASSLSQAQTFQLFSDSVADGVSMSKSQEYVGFGCSGDNISPALSWRGEPEGTRSFAVTLYDPDAPTGSGWWHWQLVNIPASTNALPANAGNPDSGLAPSGSIQIENDYGSFDFGGACPPPGHGPHRYQFTVFALSVESLDVSAETPAALVGYMLNANSLATATIETLYER